SDAHKMTSRMAVAIARRRGLTSRPGTGRRHAAEPAIPARGRSGSAGAAGCSGDPEATAGRRGTPSLFPQMRPAGSGKAVVPTARTALAAWGYRALRGAGLV